MLPMLWDRRTSQGLRGDLIALYSDLKGGCGEVEVGLFPCITIDRMRTSLKLCWGVSGWILGKISSLKVSRHWNRLSREMVESLSLEVLKKYVDMVQRDMV